MQIYMLFRQQAGISALRQELEVKTPYRAMNHPVIGVVTKADLASMEHISLCEMLVTGSWSAQRVSNQCG